ncbi:MAG: PTS sugar transporter subunit IIC [Candidatus Eremiobacteraeota bacterium]|nr:PTS sugar transporter subunit IIC [Candidatus Eremiobacteraeota bacterium]
MAFALLPSFAIMAIALVVLLARELALQLHLPIWAMLLSATAAFFLSPPPGAHRNVIAYLHALGTVGLFLAIALALICAAIFTAIRRFGPQRFMAPINIAATLAIIAVAAMLFHYHISPAKAILIALRPLGSLGDTYAALLGITVVETALWIAGIHGPATLAAIVTPVYLTLQLQNTAAFSNHAPLPHLVVVSTFLFVFPGGAGATLPLVILMLFTRAARLKNVARLTILPAIFNLNEPLLFGLPVVFNPFLCVPFVLAPAVLATITYLAMRFGFVHAPIFYVPSSVPTVASTYVATLDWRAVVLVLANIVIAGLIYAPFVRAYDRHEVQVSLRTQPA